MNTYDVFRFTNRGHWDLVGEEISATHPTAAIMACDQHAPDDERYGKFMVVRSENLVLFKRSPEGWDSPDVPF